MIKYTGTISIQPKGVVAVLHNSILYEDTNEMQSDLDTEIVLFRQLTSHMQKIKGGGYLLFTCGTTTQ
jgi:hypothetical protein